MRRLGLVAAALAAAAVPIWADEAHQALDRAPDQALDRASDPPKDCYNCDEWNQAQSPFRIHGSTYFVGVHGLSTVAVLTSDGVVLFDAGLPQSVATIAANLETIGSSLSAVRLIATSHEHYDHVGGVAGAQRASGATVLARAPGLVALRAGGPSPEDPQAGFGVAENAFAAVTGAVREVADGERIRLGDFEMTAHATPGHTLGATTWSWRSCEGEQCVDFVYADSLNPVAAPGFRYSNNPERVQAFEASIAKVASLPCDIIVSVHPGFTNLYDKLAARERDPKGTNPFLDPAGCRTYAADAAERLAGRLAAEREGREP
jgi:metallo-beta-lactamase class B